MSFLAARRIAIVTIREIRRRHPSYGPRRSGRKTHESIASHCRPRFESVWTISLGPKRKREGTAAAAGPDCCEFALRQARASGARLLASEIGQTDAPGSCYTWRR